MSVKAEVAVAAWPQSFPCSEGELAAASCGCWEAVNVRVSFSWYFTAELLNLSFHIIGNAGTDLDPAKLRICVLHCIRAMGARHGLCGTWAFLQEVWLTVETKYLPLPGQLCFCFLPFFSIWKEITECLLHYLVSLTRCFDFCGFIFLQNW